MTSHHDNKNSKMNKTLFEILDTNPKLRGQYNLSFEKEMIIECWDVRFPAFKDLSPFGLLLRNGLEYETEATLNLNIVEFSSLFMSDILTLQMSVVSMAIECVNRRTAKELNIGSYEWLHAREIVNKMQHTWHEIMKPHILNVENKLLTRFNLTKSFESKSIEIAH